MKYLKLNPEYRNTNPVEYFIYKGEKYPTKEGYGKDNETFIYGKGYVKIGAKAKRFLAQPLPENYNANDVIASVKEHGIYVTLKLIAERYNSSDCVYYDYNSELKNILQFGESYDNFLQLAYDIDNKVVTILKEKYGVFLKGGFKELHFDNPNVYNTIPAYYRNSRSGSLNTRNYLGHFFSGNIDLSIMGIFTTKAQYNSMEHEPSIKSMIQSLSTKFPITGRIYNEIDGCTDKKLLTLLENMSVKDMIKALYGNEVCEMADNLNSFELKESNYHKELQLQTA